MRMDDVDEISLHSLALHVNIGPDCWLRNRSQPVLLTVRALIPLARVAETDDIRDTVHYGHLANTLLGLQSLSFHSLFHLANSAISHVLDNPEFSAIHTVHIHAEAPKLLLQARALSVHVSRKRDQKETEFVNGTIEISDLALPVIIGVNPPERIHKQQVIVSMSFPVLPPWARAWLDPSGPPYHQVILQKITDHICSSQFFTLEALVSSIARVFLLSCDQDCHQVSVQARKPSAITQGEGSSVRLTRTRSFFD